MKTKPFFHIVFSVYMMAVIFFAIMINDVVDETFFRIFFFTFLSLVAAGILYGWIYIIKEMEE